MKDLLKKGREGFTEETRRILKFLAIPLAVLILMAVIVVMDKPVKESTKDTEAVLQSTEALEETKEQQGEEEKKEMAELTLKEASTEVKDVLEAYFKARRTCDTELLKSLYGDTCSQEKLHNERIRMEEEVKFYQSFDNLICYTAPGLLEGDAVVYARFDIKFRQADTLAPSMIVCYVKTNADGAVYLVAEPDAEQSAFLEETNRSSAVQAMAKEVNESLTAALESDENLLAVYHTLTDGEPGNT